MPIETLTIDEITGFDDVSRYFLTMKPKTDLPCFGVDRSRTARKLDLLPLSYIFGVGVK